MRPVPMVELQKMFKKSAGFAALELVDFCPEQECEGAEVLERKARFGEVWDPVQCKWFVSPYFLLKNPISNEAHLVHIVQRTPNEDHYCAYLLKRTYTNITAAIRSVVPDDYWLYRNGFFHIQEEPKNICCELQDVKFPGFSGNVLQISTRGELFTQINNMWFRLKKAAPDTYYF